jgi:hypothetical protein
MSTLANIYASFVCVVCAGISYAAAFYYKKALDMQPVVKDDDVSIKTVVNICTMLNFA